MALRSYKQLTDEQKAEILRQRLTGLEAEHYSQSLVEKINGEKDDPTQEQLAKIETAIGELSDELKEIEAKLEKDKD